MDNVNSGQSYFLDERTNDFGAASNPGFDPRIMHLVVAEHESNSP